MKKITTYLMAVLVCGGAFAQQKKDKKSPAPLTAPTMTTLLDSFSYAAGVNIANNMKDQGISNLNTALMVRAVDDVLKNRKLILSPEQCNNSLQEQMAVFNKKKEEESKINNAAEKAKGEAFLAQNKSRSGVTTLPNGLQYEIIKAGDPAGVKPTVQDTVVVDYRGTLTNGTEFDASAGRGPATFPLNGVIRGWTEILQLMTVGSQWKVYIPADMAYGDRGAGAQIPGGATLIFEITLHEVKPAVVK